MSTSDLSILLIVENPFHRAVIARELRGLGCDVLSARDLDEAARVVARKGVPATLLLVRLGGPHLSDHQLRGEIAGRLPGWGVETTRQLAAYVATGRGRRARTLN